MQPVGLWLPRPPVVFQNSRRVRQILARLQAFAFLEVDFVKMESMKIEVKDLITFLDASKTSENCLSWDLNFDYVFISLSLSVSDLQNITESEVSLCKGLYA